MVPADASLRESIEACVEQARRFVRAGRAVQTSGEHSIAFGLGIMALEELGKRELLFVENIDQQSDVPLSWPKKHAFDHEQKLFWCFFGSQRLHDLTKDTFFGMKELAKTLHEKRLAAFYVDNTPDGASTPDTQVTEVEADNLLKFAEARLAIAEHRLLREDITEEEIAEQRWFFDAVEDPELKRLIFSKASLEKMAELNEPREWVAWLKAQVQDARDRGAEVLTQELERSKSLPERKQRDKWNVRFRLKSASHSIRPTALNHFNKRISMFQLSPVNGNKRELIVDLRMGDQVPLQNLYPSGFDIGRMLVVALNMGTLGFFWFELSSQQTQWFEKVEDLDNKDINVGVELNPGHKIEWGERLALSEKDMDQVLLTFSALSQELGRRSFIGPYIHGLTQLAKSDVHHSGEPAAFGGFLSALHLLMVEMGDLKEGEAIAPAIDAHFKKKGTPLDGDEPMLEIIRNFDGAKQNDGKVVLKNFKPEHAAMMKTITDGYFATAYRAKALERLSAEVKDLEEEPTTEGEPRAAA